MRTMTVTDASRHFSDLINRVHYRGESALLLKGGRPVARLLPARTPKTGRELARAWGQLPHLSQSEADALAQDIETARQYVPAPVSKWG